MPFTFSHPAIVLPFSKIRSSYVSVSCLVVGSIIPDFEYFFTMKATGRFSHTIPGAFAFGLPVALAAVMIFHFVVKGPLINSLPSYFHNRLVDLREFDFLKNFKQNFIGYILCLLVGIFSHIAWDSFTDANAYFVERFKELTKPVDHSFLPSWPVYHYFQHISTAIGALVILYFFHHQSAHAKKNKLNRKYWVSILFTSLITFSIRWVFGFEYFADVVASLISSLLLSMIIISALFTLHSPKPKS